MQSTTAWRLSVIGFALAATLLAGVGWLTFRGLADLRAATGEVQHTLLVRADAEGVLSLLKDAETGQRGFVITAAAAFLEPYESALAALPPRVVRLRQLTIDNPTQQASITTLDGLIERKLAEMRENVATRQRDGFEAAAQRVETGTGKRIMDEARGVVVAIDAEEGRLLAEREAIEDRDARYAVVTSLGGLGVAIGLLLVATSLMNRAISQREQERMARTTAEAVTAAVQQSEERLRVTIASIGDAVIATDDQGRVTRLNGIAEALTGWTQADAIGRPLAEVLVIINERSRQPAENPVYRVLQDGAIVGLANHTLLVAKDGREIAIDDSAAPIRTQDGRMAGVVMVFRDITERRRAEREIEALLERERAAREDTERARREVETTSEQLVAALQAGRMGTWQYTMATGDVKWSAGLEAIHGFAAGSFPGTFEAFRNEIYPADRDHVLDAIGAAVEERREHHVEYRIVRPDGAVRWVEGRGQLFCDHDGRPERMVGVCVDVTERKASEQRFRLAIEAAPTAMIMVDKAGTIVLANALTERLLGYVRSEIVGRSIEQLVPSRFRSSHPEHRRSFLADARQRPMGAGRELYALHKDGSEIPVEIGLSPIETAEGVLVVAAVTDITERKQLEDARAHLLVREQAARVEIERANRLKDDFLAVLSHELRTPLNAVLGYARLLISGALPPERSGHALDAIQRNAQAQARLVESLLDLSRIIAGKLELDRERLDLSSVVTAAVDVIRPEADAKTISVDVEMPSSGIALIGDGGRLQQVFWNLLSNAIKFTPRGGHVGVRVMAEDSQVQIQVSDSGQGISPDFLPHVFERFKQADDHKSGAPAGLGLGLALVREMVHAHGGTVIAESRGEGQGSVFTVTLPLSTGAVAPTSTDTSTLQPDTVAPPQPMDILIVDDDGDVRDLLALLLVSRGAMARTVSSAAEALDALSQRPPDVLLADLRMPDEDGYSLIQRLRAREREQQHGRLPAIAVTASASAKDREQALAAGYDWHVAKPVDADELWRAIARLANAYAV